MKRETTEDKYGRTTLILAGAFLLAAPLSAKGRKPPAPHQEKAAQAAPVVAPAQPPAPLPPQEAAPLPALRKISLEEAKKIFDEGKALFIDGRAPASYEVRHVKGALNCSLGSFAEQFAPIRAKIDPGTMLVVYCSGETCGLAERIGGMLLENGYKNVVIFSAGWPAWAQAGYPAEP